MNEDKNPSLQESTLLPADNQNTANNPNQTPEKDQATVNEIGPSGINIYGNDDEGFSRT